MWRQRGTECAQCTSAAFWPLGLEATPSRASSLPRRLQQREGGWQGRQGPRAASGDTGTSATSLLAPRGLSPTFFRKAPFCSLFPQPAGHPSGAEELDIRRTSFPPSVSRESRLLMNGKGEGKGVFFVLQAQIPGLG